MLNFIISLINNITGFTSFIHFANYEYIFIFLFLFLLSIFILINRYKKERAKLFQLTSKDNIKINLENYSIFKKKLKLLLDSLALFFIFLALLRPQWNEEEINVEQSGKDILIVLDISRSMLAQDINPNRLLFAKSIIKKVVDLLSPDRVGLILFASKAFSQCPLTSDLEAFTDFLNGINNSTVANGSTNLDSVIIKIADIYSKVENSKNKLAVVLTDGEDFSNNLENMKETIKNNNIKLFIIGIGTTQGAPIPIYNKDGEIIGMQKENGQIVITKLNSDLLNEFAQLSGGIYIDSNNQNLDLIVKQINKYDKEKYENTTIKKYEEKFYYFAGLGFICLLISWLI